MVDTGRSDIQAAELDSREEVKDLFTILQAGIPYLRARFRREDGAVATEYGLLLALVAIAIIVALGLLAAALNGVFSDATTTLNNR